MAWNGKDLEVRQAAKDNNCTFIKRRKTYAFVGFPSWENREAFKTALGQITGIQFQNWEVNDMDLYVVRVAPA